MSRITQCLLTSFLSLICVSLSYGQCGDPPDNLDCFTARELPGYPGTHEAEMDAAAAFVTGSEPTPQCAANVGHTVWFKVTPVVDGTLTLTTCHPNTTYDTVVQAYTGDCGGALFGPAWWCDDDDPAGACINACEPNFPRASTVTIDDAVAGTEYYFQVGSYNDNSAGCTLCLGVYLTVTDRCDSDTEYPTAAITAPGELGAGCVCGVVDVMGWADDPNGVFESYRLKWGQPSGASWTVIQDGTTPVAGGVLGTWDTTGIAQGYYLLHLTARDSCGKESTAARVVYVDGFFDSLNFRYPPGAGAPVVSGQVCFEGTVSDSWCFDAAMAEYRPVGGGPFLPADQNMNPSASVVNEPIATWDTIGLGLPDGDYELRLTGTTNCGATAQAVQTVTLDNTPPTALISDPLNCDQHDAIVQIIGTADDANLNVWYLQATGGPYNGWVTLNSGTTPVTNGLFLNWDTSALPACAYTLRLVVYDQAVRDCASPVRQSSEHTVSMEIESCPGDIDNDGDVDLSDLATLLAFYGATCP